MTKNRKDTILRHRAEKLRQKLVRPVENVSLLEGLEFLLTEEKYILPAEYINEVIYVHAITALPGTPDFLSGLINLRGNIVSVLDIKKLFHLPEKGITNLNRVIVVSDADIEFGILADDILGYVEVDTNSLQKQLSDTWKSLKEFAYGITAEGQIVLNIAALIHSPDIIINEKH